LIRHKITGVSSSVRHFCTPRTTPLYDAPPAPGIVVQPTADVCLRRTNDDTPVIL
jgi:hypothetical protein